MAESLRKIYGEMHLKVTQLVQKLKPQINQDAVRIIKDLYKVDMNETQKSKLLSDIPTIDIAIKWDVT